ncbi:MAG: MFS transporter [Leptolyngbyaceae cyanobacterium]
MPKLPPLPLTVRLSYGIGELAAAVPVSLAAFFLLYFLTSVAGLSPALAGQILLMGRLWDAVNDPLVGWLSDRTQSPLGRRFPWILFGVVPLSICTVLIWHVPDIASQQGRLFYYSILSFFAFAAFTAVQIPHTALAAELSEDYDERMGLIGIKSAFNIGGGIAGLIAAQVVFSKIANPEQQYQVLGYAAAGLAIVATGIGIAGTYQRYQQVQDRHLSYQRQAISPDFVAAIGSIFKNSAFRHVLGLYFCGWIGLQLTAAMLPYFVDVWMGLPATHFAQMALAVQGTAIATIPVWEQIAQRSDKRTVVLLGGAIALAALASFITVQPDQVVWMYVLGIVVGSGIATLYVGPFAMLPDVIDWDELQTGYRREGLYFSAVVFLQKLGLALALFVSGQLLQHTGFVIDAATQPLPALWLIRLLLGPLPAVLLLLGLWFAYQYPITRKRYQQILTALEAARMQRVAR